MFFMPFMVRKKVILCGLKTFLCVLCGKEVRLKRLKELPLHSHVDM